MRLPLYLVNNLANKIADRETDNINKARVRMLIYILLSYAVFSGILIIVYFIEEQYLQLLRISFVFAAAVFFIAIINKNIIFWKPLSHILVSLLTLAVLSNLTIFVKGVNIATLQFVWFACALGFYMHGIKWGWFYACINVVSVIAFTMFDANYFFLGNPQEIALGSYLFVISYNFALILFLHHYFFKAFNSNFISLTLAKNELNALNQKLHHTLFDLEELSKARMNFLSTMSHELRTPMNGVIGISNALLQQNPREDQKSDLAILKFSAENLLSLINDILDFNKLDAGKIVLESIDFDLVTLIENTFLSSAFKAKEKNLDFNFSVDEQLRAKLIISDPTRLTQVLLNLLNNAIKFTDAGSVSLAAKVLDLDDDTIKVRFMVTDTGIGIDVQNQLQIFEAFVQAASYTSRYYGGTGLGLPIVKKILEMFNSKVYLESKPGEGTKIFFDIDFQYKEAKTAVINKHIRPTTELSGLNILVAEDNQVNVLVIKKTLALWGIIPVIAANGIAVLEELNNRDFDLILMDLYMPEMDGYQAAMAIRQLPNPVKARIPIIAFTATVNSDTAKKVAEFGMNDYLPKPFNPHHLFEKLQQIVLSNS